MSTNPPTINGQSYVSGTFNTRRNVMAMGGEGDTGLVTPTNSDVCQRYGFTIPSTAGAPINRFRFRLRNANNKLNTTQAGAITLGAFAIGTPNTGAENSWSGDFTGVPTTVIAAPGSTEVGSSEYVSAWVSPSTFNLLPNTFYGLTLGFTCSGVQVNASATPGWSWVGTGSAAANLVAAVPGTTPQPYTQYLDLRIEYEYNSTNEVGLFIGDSLGSGWLNTFSGSVASGHMGPDNAWPHQAALRLGHHPMNAGVGGIGTVGFVAATTSTNLAWTRFLSPESGNTAFASAPDYAVIMLVINDSTAVTGLSLATFQANYRTIISRLQALGITRIYAATEGQGYTGSILNVSQAWQAGALNAAPANPIVSLTIPQVLGPGFGVGQPGAATAWWNAGTGPYTVYLGTPQAPVGGPYTLTNAVLAASVLTLSVSGTPARPAGAVAGCPVLTASEYNRQNFNLWLRSLPPSITAVIDFDADVTSQFYYPSATGRPEFYNNSGDAHPTGGGMYSLMASRFVNGILGN